MDRLEAAGFRLAPGMADEIIAHARAGYPEEVCGILSGRDGRAMALYRGRNIAPTPRVTYELDVYTLALQIDFADAGLELAGIYHSHPAGPETPSATDIALAFYPEAVYLICSLANPERPVLRAFRIAANITTEVQLSAP
jgi:proteasome lid subunit RPN8/RPN11